MKLVYCDQNQSNAPWGLVRSSRILYNPVIDPTYAYSRSKFTLQGRFGLRVLIIGLSAHADFVNYHNCNGHSCPIPIV